MGPLLGLGLCAALVAPVLPGAAAALAWLAGWTAAWIAFCARLVARLPGAQTSSLALLVGAAVVAFAISGVTRLPRWRRQLALTIVAAAVPVAAAAWWALSRPAPFTAPHGLRVTFLDIGQGDAELLEVPQGAMLVDTGPPEGHVDRQLLGMGVRSLSAVVLTHPHRDHVGGAPAVFEHLRVGELLDPEQPGDWLDEREAQAAARAHHVPIVAARVGQEFHLGRLVVRVLWPDSGGRIGEHPHKHARRAARVLRRGRHPAHRGRRVRRHVSPAAPSGRGAQGRPPRLRRYGAGRRASHPQTAVRGDRGRRQNVYGLPKPSTVAALLHSPGSDALPHGRESPHRARDRWPADLGPARSVE